MHRHRGNNGNSAPSCGKIFKKGYLPGNRSWKNNLKNTLRMEAPIVCTAIATLSLKFMNKKGGVLDGSAFSIFCTYLQIDIPKTFKYYWLNPINSAINGISSVRFSCSNWPVMVLHSKIRLLFLTWPQHSSKSSHWVADYKTWYLYVRQSLDILNNLKFSNQLKLW